MQDQQREGWVPESVGPDIVPDTPRTNALRSRYPAHSGKRYSDELTLCAVLETELIGKNAQIVALREAITSVLSGMDATDPDYTGSIAGEISTAEFDRLNKALSTPAPKVVPLEDVRPLIDALKIIAANPAAKHGPNCLYDSGPIATGAIAKFTTTHPL